MFVTISSFNRSSACHSSSLRTGAVAPRLSRVAAVSRGRSGDAPPPLPPLYPAVREAQGLFWRIRGGLLITRMVQVASGAETADEVGHPCAIRRLPPKADRGVLEQLLALEKKLFRKQDNWGDLLVKEIQRRNTFLLYAEAPAPTSVDAGAHAGPTAPPRGKKSAPLTARRGQQQQPQQPRLQQQPAACVAGYIIFTTAGLNAHISKLAVATEWRRRGIARSLVRAAVHAARTERRVASLSLHVDAENLPALGLYRGEGFCEDGFLEDYYSPGRHAHKMRLELSSDL